MASVTVPAALLERRPLPTVCAVTGAAATRTHRRRVEWAPLWTWVGLALGLLPCALLRHYYGKRVTVHVPESLPRARRRWLLTAAPLVSGAGAAGSVSLMPYNEAAAEVLLVACFLAILPLLVWRLGLRPRVTFDSTHVRFAGVHPDFAAAVAEWIAAMQQPAAVARSGWYADPAAQFEYRWFDGMTWTDHVCTNGVVGIAPLAYAR